VAVQLQDDNDDNDNNDNSVNNVNNVNNPITVDSGPESETDLLLLRKRLIEKIKTG
jgi:hypothetical protein